MSDLDSRKSPTNNYSLTFDREFFRGYASKLISDPKIAIVEVVANCWDAGADRVDITWPMKRGESIVVEDNGSGMTYDEFFRRWYTLGYNRLAEQGKDVKFPLGNKSSQRQAYGRNGKGRHSMFCFDFEYIVETWRDGITNSFKVTQTTGRLFDIEHLGKSEKPHHGTRLSSTYNLVDDFIPASEIAELIGTKFVADPTFDIYVNGKRIDLQILDHLSEKREIEIDRYGSVTVRLFDSQKKGRTSQQHGVAWHVNNRLVGDVSWTTDVVRYLDGRTSQAKQYTFVVLADILADQVEADWSEFQRSEKTIKVQSKVNENILDWVQTLFQDVRRERSRKALMENSEYIDKLPRYSRRHIERFADELQRQSPTINVRELSVTIKVLSNLEQTRTGYYLLEQLASLSPDDLDRLSDILHDWSVRDAQVVLDELDWRLKVIRGLEKVVEVDSDELHEIHPLFNRGLWIFGHEYEGIDFMSNRWLATIIRDYFNDKVIIADHPQQRPDIVALPNSSIEIYARNSYDENADPDSIGKILILELKRGGFEITRQELSQAETYANQISKSGKVRKDAEIICFVLGTRLAEDVSDKTDRNGKTKIYGRTYSTILEKAKARTFNLQRKIDEARQNQPDFYDSIIESS